MLLQLRERPARAVGVRERQPEARRPGDRQNAVGAGDLQRHERLDGAAVEPRDHVEQGRALVAAPDALVGDRRRADHAARHDERVVVEIVEADDADGTVLGDRPEGHRQGEVRVAAAAGAHGRAARGQGREVGGIESRTVHGHKRLRAT